MPRLRIVRTPGGAAPEHVRRAWVGLELPLIKQGEFTVQSVLEHGFPRTGLERLWARLTGRLRKGPGFAAYHPRRARRARGAEAARGGVVEGERGAPADPRGVFDAGCGEVIE